MALCFDLLQGRMSTFTFFFTYTIFAHFYYFKSTPGSAKLIGIARLSYFIFWKLQFFIKFDEDDQKTDSFNQLLHKLTRVPNLLRELQSR